VNKRKTKQKAGGNQAERHKFKSPPEKGWENALPIVRVCAYICVCVCAEVEIRSRFRRFSRSFGQNRKNRTTPARVQNLKMGKKKSSRTAKKNSAARKIPVSQRIAKRVTESYKRHF